MKDDLSAMRKAVEKIMSGEDRNLALECLLNDEITDDDKSFARDVSDFGDLVIGAAAKCRGIRREQVRCSLVIDAMTGPVKSGPGISIRTPKSQGWQSLH